MLQKKEAITEIIFQIRSGDSTITQMNDGTITISAPDINLESDMCCHQSLQEVSKL